MFNKIILNDNCFLFNLILHINEIAKVHQAIFPQILLLYFEMLMFHRMKYFPIIRLLKLFVYYYYSSVYHVNHCLSKKKCQMCQMIHAHVAFNFGHQFKAEIN